MQCLCVPFVSAALVAAIVAGTWADSSSGMGSGVVAPAKPKMTGAEVAAGATEPHTEFRVVAAMV